MTDYKHLVERLRMFGGEADTGSTYHEAAEAIESLVEENKNLRKGEFICQRCGLRKDAESDGKPDF